MISHHNQIDSLTMTVGFNSIPLIVTWKTLDMPKVVHLICSAKTKPYAIYLREVFESRESTCHIHCLDNRTASSLSAIEHELEDNASLKTDALAYSGGKKTMAVGVHSLWRKNGGDLSSAFSVDPAMNSLRPDDGEPIPFPSDVFADIGLGDLPESRDLPKSADVKRIDLNDIGELFPDEHDWLGRQCITKVSKELQDNSSSPILWRVDFKGEVIVFGLGKNGLFAFSWWEDEDGKGWKPKPKIRLFQLLAIARKFGGSLVRIALFTTSTKANVKATEKTIDRYRRVQGISKGAYKVFDIQDFPSWRDNDGLPIDVARWLGLDS